MSDNSKGVVYLDSSALVKLIVEEPESAALREYLGSRPTGVSCALARVEVPRAVARHGPEARRLSRDLLARLRLLMLDDALLDAAADLDPVVLRSLDAIHLAAALSFGEDLTALVAYDVRMLQAAELLAIRCEAPA